MSMKGLFCGSFDPFTFGHLYVVKKALEICDELVICVGKNDEKMPLIPADTRVNLIKDVLQNAGITNVEVFADAGLMVDVAKKHCVDTLIRGVRSGDWCTENQLAVINAKLAEIRGFELKTELVLQNDELLSVVSSSTVKELCKHEEYVALLDMVPAEVHRFLMVYPLCEVFASVSDSDNISQYEQWSEKYYNRAYHNFSHLAYMINMLNIYLAQHPDDEFKDCYRLAIFIHDYFHGDSEAVCGDELSDEERSAEVAKEWNRRLYRDVKKLVLATKHDRNDLDEEEAVMADLDLSILGTSSERVWEWYCSGIREENSNLGDAEYKAKRIEFLSGMLAKKRIFHTEFFYDMLEEQARKNIENELQKLRA